MNPADPLQPLSNFIEQQRRITADRCMAETPTPPLPDVPQSGPVQRPQPLRGPQPAAPSLDTPQTSEKKPLQPSAPATIDRLQFTEEWKPEDDPTQMFVHSGWATTRKRVHHSLVRTQQSSERIFRFEECGTSAWVYQSTSSPSDLKVLTNHCGDRLCLVCSKLKAARIADALHEHCKEKPRLRFLTLTLANTSKGLADSLDRLYRHFKSLRNTDWWEDHVTGGVAFLEIKYSEKARRWHPHFHLIVEGSFIPQAELQEAWKGITHDSFIVDVRACHDSEKAASYAAKYAGKPMTNTFAGNPDLLDEATVALKGRRLFFCFGKWYGTKLSQFESEGLFDDEADPSWTSLGSFRDLCFRADGGDAAASIVVCRLRALAEARSRLDSG